MTFPHDHKQALRAKMRAERDRFAASNQMVIMPPRALLTRLKPGLIVASYHPIGAEADPSHLHMAAHDAGARLALPHVTGKATPMRFLAWHPDHDLAEGPFGLRQPLGDEELAPDIILTPLIAFDRDLNRLGQGAGHYDRAFAQYPRAWRLGVAWSVQQTDSLPSDSWDIPLHAIVTERAYLEKED
ncbi:5-formyltetrahydrofolate cyclo-ligase [Stakelama marina]|uniref:5-formyltetrahydrofolate cyclo-ligase n=1 Tax=Stakelama marina TaxID=2826939 RepID=A0A8T4IEL4_9SPHN|nr:5-formyltetrahydrofolate cyclo-ligase [Stakelama marina]MBR0551445.1 5-formyltetrahydrofolate cyclo-ligase [Stakelama marina]